jgi:teichuronic acid biosynthesis glycosyltransferase TuaG
VNKLVSIITPMFNSEKYIADTIKSVISQTYKNWEMIIVDDCSSDNSVNVVKDFTSNDNRIKLIQLDKNSGPAVSRNVAIEKSNGQYMTFIDSDDLWKNNYLDVALNKLSEKDIHFVFSSYYRRNSDLSTNYGEFIVPLKVSYFDTLKTCSISCLTAMYDVSFFGKQYMELLDKRQDYSLWLKLLKKVDYAHGIQQPLATYRMRPGSVSRNKRKAAKYQWKIYRQVENLNLLSSIFYFINYTVNGIIKYSFNRKKI